MQEIVKLVAQKTGMSEDIAKVAVETVLGFLKDKLPAPLAGQLDAVIGAGAPDGGGGPDLGALAKQGLGGLFK